MTLADAVVRAVTAETPFVDPAVEAGVVGESLVFVAVRDRDPGPSGPETAAAVAHRPPGPGPAVPSGTDAVDVGRWLLDPPGSANDPPGSAGDPPDSSASDDASGPDPRVGRAVGAATLNALSAPAVDWRSGDPFERLAGGVETVATVGLFGPALRKFGATTVRVIELDPVDPEAPPGVTVESYVADPETGVPADVEGVLAGVDALFLTGSALIYGGVDRYLAAVDPRATVVLVGATASFVPGPAFDAGVDVLAGARVTDPEGVRRAAEGGVCGTDLHGEGIEKVFVSADDRATTGDPG